jgi:2-polyprenyl-6-methoxyphenol hydroxylase-like FAD-dependent oxidoreductase
MQIANRSRHDVVVVGGRVAGAATAMLLARLGHEVVVVDQASFPSDTVSTHSIARSGVVQLRRWGLLDAVLDSGGPAIRQVTFTAAGASVTRTIKDKAGVDLLVAPRRYVLDTILVGAAEHAGAEMRPGVTVTGVRRDGRGRVVGVHGHDRAGAPVEFGARWVVGADGLGSRVAGLVDTTINEAGPDGGAAQYAYYHGGRWAGFEFFVAERSFAGVFPTHHSQACIWVCTPTG